ncbi:MAG: RagB/SusD family nutrient uptake outer membrane protein [Bacteroidales bacterium]|nr:RagB/SusD family nutrient uptake outer membrane protein [Bacteroidales bacterium]
MKKYKYLLIFAFVILTLGGCNDDEFLSLKTPLEKPWNSLQEFDKAAIGAYQKAFLSDWHNVQTTSVLLKSFQSDEVQLLPGSIGAIPFAIMYPRQSKQDIDKTSHIFRYAYQVIAICNGALDYLEKGGGNPFSNLTQADIDNNLKRIKGELLFMRAFSYYRLSQVFIPPYESAGPNSDKILPWKINLNESAEAQVKTELATTQMVYDQMVKDLQEAKSLLPEAFSASVHFASYKYGRANKYAAASLLGKVYFAMGKSAESIAELDFVINSGKYDLSEEPLAAFQKYKTADAGKETIWYAYTGNTDYGGWQMAELTSICLQMPNNGNFARCSWNQLTFSYSTLKNIGWMTDPKNGDFSLTPEALADKRLGSTYTMTTGKDQYWGMVTTPQIWCDKYFNGDASKNIEGQNLNIPIIRLAELYLTRSWLKFKANDLAGATSDLNVVRNRAGIGNLGHAITADDIINERIKEMFMEGDRTDFLRAAHLDIPPGDREGVAVQPYNTQDLIWALPKLSETDINQAYQ